MCEIIIKDSKYYLKPNIIPNNYLYNTTELSKLSWLVYKSLKPPFNKKKYSLREGDVIKLGRETLLIRSIHVRRNRIKYLNLNRTETENKNNKGIFSFHTETNQSLDIDEDFNENKISDKEKEKNDKENKDKKENDKKEELNLVSINEENESKSNKDLVSNNTNTDKKKKICRICYLEEENKESNPLIKPCKCSGSMKYIHYECLLHWLKTRLIINKRSFIDNGFFDIYKQELIECELCKNLLQNYINHNNKIYSLIDYLRLDKDKVKEKEKMLPKKGKKKKEENNYLIFDDIVPGKSGFLCRYLVKFDQDNILRIGRGLDNQLILNDISVSRNHCIIKLDENYNLILEDCNSKFGSLILIQAEEIEILKGKTLTVQIGTNYLSFKLVEKKKFFSCCNTEEIDHKGDYEKLNSNCVKYDKTNEILNESISGQESGNENNENKSENNKIENKDLIDDNNNNENIIKLDINKNNENINMNTNINNLDSAINISTLKVNNQINMSQNDNRIEEINEENKSENEKKSNSIIIENEDNNKNDDSDDES